MNAATRTAYLLIVALCLVASRGVADASPFAARRVPAQARGVVHLNVDKLRSSPIWQVILAKLPDDARARMNKELGEELLKAWEDQGEDVLGVVALSLLAKTRSVTVWSDGAGQSALLIELPLRLGMLGLLEKAKSLKSSIQNGIKLYHIGDDMLVSVVGSTLVVSQLPGPLIATAQLAGGKGKSLASGSLGKLVSARKDVLLAAGVSGPMLESLKASAASLPLPADIRSVQFFSGQKRAIYYGETKLQVESADAATKLAGMMKGLLGLASIGNDDPTVTALLKGLTIKAQGAAVTARVELSEKLLTKLISQN
jgi:hypothetical protein